ncbi:MAG: helix-turn-helix domain-containing protein [Mesorhizobium sp.]|nr:helix-turn-helix domain-containing protein [bacterium M00.F.Ca.ET.205.01.1.1]TGU54453.1 helix-turn-helix domain-containing protein [bacterium M00.F.Ca.ET.152.01.1.1]TGV38760.1 helix-turn-helix domain-containing protein [Mesorhizobium sp. M00.F.Ca.ET.186.01.1.1]TGZ44026.1 helix-turn-helix domain-containing protein [bacterium M00.F.Ca.ET.162.01.1.1]TJW33836.1 MAG: helix-turn-helix domain-containing protein [Mesorhizobium sp.]
MGQSSIPDFFVYGEPVRPLDIGFLHVETVAARSNIHLGQVAAHKHPQMGQITYWTAGSGTYRIEDRSWDFSAPAVSFVPSNVVHGFSIGKDADAIVVSVADDALAALSAYSLLPLDRPVFADGLPQHAAWKRLAGVLNMIAAEYAEAEAGNEKTLPALIAVALSHIARLSPQVKDPTGSTDASLALGLRRLVDTHFRDNWPVDRYVEALATTPHLLDKAAHAVLGSGVKRVISERRLLEAKRLLLFTVRTIEDIAYEIGFDDPAYFSRFFRERAGEAPAAWRRKQLQGH